jgi:decaprenylphospho-beta-D-erythro-pentofuranosid-2-ulose 2-reductase
MERLLIVGATSEIAQAVARRFAQRGAALHLVARNGERLTALADDLRVRGAQGVTTSVLDANQYDQHAPVLAAATQALGQIDSVLIAHGTLGDQKACEQSVELTLRELSTNALSVLALLTLLANQMERQGSGTLCVIGSVAGDRGRQSNYVYGTAKAAVATFVQGLRNRLERKGVKVVTIKPGFVDTPMTASFKKGLLWADPAAVAAGIDHAMHGKSGEYYLPFFWAWIMLIIRSVPEGIFKRLSL